MGKEFIKDEIIKQAFQAVPHLLKFPTGKMWIDYDKEADVLYISFKRPQKATESEMLDSGLLVRYRGDEIVGLTIMDASKKKPAKRNKH